MIKIYESFVFILLVFMILSCDKTITGPEEGNIYKIAFTGLSFEQGERIYIINSDGSNQKLLNPSLSGDSWLLSWSPDGRKIAFNNAENVDIYVMDSDGQNLKNLTNNPAVDLSATWSPDGQNIAFFSDRDGQYNIYVMESDGSNQRQLTTDAFGINSMVWSPNSEMISYICENSDTSRIYVVDADGSNQRFLTEQPITCFNLAWSPDGSTLAFSGGNAPPGGMAHDNSEIYTMSSSGENLRQLTNNDVYDGGSVWSSDGKEIFFFSSQNGSTIYKMNADGSNQKRIATVGDGASLNFSSDHRMVIYYSTNNPSRIYLMNIDGTNRRRLTRNNAGFRERYAVWSPVPIF